MCPRKNNFFEKAANKKKQDGEKEQYCIMYLAQTNFKLVKSLLLLKLCGKTYG